MIRYVFIGILIKFLMEIIKIQHVEEVNREFYRIMSFNCDRIREINVRRDDSGYVALYQELSSFYPGSKVNLEFVGDFPEDVRDALEDLVVVHNIEIEGDQKVK
jgi:hypothetical protein